MGKIKVKVKSGAKGKPLGVRVAEFKAKEGEKGNKEYERRVNEALNEDFNKEIDLGLGDKKTSPDAEALILQNSKLTINDIELFRFLLG